MSIALPLLKFTTKRCILLSATASYRLNTIQRHLQPASQTRQNTTAGTHSCPLGVDKKRTEGLNGQNMGSDQTQKEIKDQDQGREQHAEGKNEWKKRPPYRVHEPDEHFDVKYEANCHCGRVKYQLSREEPLDSKLCHCTTCQTQHGMKHQLIVL